MFDIVQNITLAAAVADAGTFTVSYPANRDKGAYAFNKGHRLVVMGVELVYPADFDLTFNTGNITVTNKSGFTWAAGSSVILQLDRAGEGTGRIANDRVSRLFPVQIDLGAPDVLDADGIAAAQAVAAPGNLTLNGALASGGVATFDVPRGVQIVSTGVGDTTQTATVTGTDEYGETVVEALAFNGTTPVLGKKAFKTVTKVAIDAALTGNGSAGTTDILGLPVFLRSVKQVIAELQDNVAATAGTLVKGDIAEPTATTGDVRGTYDPNAALDGAKAFSLIALLANPEDAGLAQFAG